MSVTIIINNIMWVLSLVALSYFRAIHFIWYDSSTCTNLYSSFFFCDFRVFSKENLWIQRFLFAWIIFLKQNRTRCWPHLLFVSRQSLRIKTGAWTRRWTSTFPKHNLQKIDLPARGMYGIHELTKCWQNLWIPDQNTVGVKLCERAAALTGWVGWALSSLCADVSAVNSGGRLARVWKMEKPLLLSG